MNYISQAANPFGTVTIPSGIARLGTDPSIVVGKLVQFALRTMVVGAGLYALFNLVLAGYSFLSAGDDSKKIGSAWAQIWQSMLGLAVSAGSFVLAAIFGKLLFNNELFLLQPTITLPY